jgi:hypothetical protein
MTHEKTVDDAERMVAPLGQHGQRPAAQWGLEYARFLQEAGASHLAATVLLPRRETIVRQIALPGVAGRDGGVARQPALVDIQPISGRQEAAGPC